MAFKDDIDIKKVVAAASNFDGIPQSYLPFYKQRAIYLQRIGQKLLESKFSDSPRERDFLSAIQANPAYSSNTARWASQGKFLRGFESHHGVPLKFNKQAMAYAPPAYHYKVGQYLKSNYDIEIGNVPNNRYNTHKVAHVGSKDILEGPGSVNGSLHPHGTNEGFVSYPSHEDVTPREYSDFIANKNGSMIQTAKSVYNDPDGLIQGINKRIQFTLDTTNANISLKTANPRDVYRAINRYRRDILDFTEADFGLGHRTLKAAGMGGLMGVLTNGKALDAAVNGDVKTVVKEGGKDFAAGWLSGKAVELVAPAIQRVVPSFLGGLAKIAPPIAAISAGATIGQVMKDNLEVNTAGSGRGAGRSSFSTTQTAP